MLEVDSLDSLSSANPLKKSKILSAASILFLKHGYEGCTLEAIAAKAKVGKQAVYEFFDDKSHLYSEVIRLEARRNAAVQFDVAKPVHEALTAAFEQMMQWTSRSKTFQLLKTNILTYESFPALASDLHEALRRGSVRMADYLSELDAEQRIRPLGTDAFDIATRLNGTVTGGTRHLLGHPWPARDDFTHYARLAADLLLFGSRGEPIGKVHDATRDMEPTASCPIEVASLKGMRLKKEKFEMLKKTSLEVFLKNGLSATSIDDLIKPAGISRATIYRQFESKIGFFRYLIEEEVARLGQERITVPDAPVHKAAMQSLAAEVLRRHLEPRSIRMHRLLIRELAIAPDLARRFYDCQISRLRPSLDAIYREHLGTVPSEFDVRAFHTLATHGVRYLVSSTDLDPQMIQAQSGVVSRIMSPLDL